MARQYQIPGGAYANETGAKQYQIPGVSYLNDTVATSTGNTIAVPKGSLVLTSKVPTVTATDNKTIAVPKGSLTLTGKVPTISVTLNNLISVPLATLTLTAFAPTILGGTVAARGVVPAGSAGKGGRRRRKFVELDGKLIEVRNQKEAIAAIRAFAEQAKQQAETKVARAVIKSVAKQRPVDLKVPEIAISEDFGPSIIPQIEMIQSDLNRAYEAAFFAMQQALEEDDEEAIFVLTH